MICNLGDPMSLRHPVSCACGCTRERSVSPARLCFMLCVACCMLYLHEGMCGCMCDIYIYSHMIVYINESHIRYEWVVSRMNESCHTWRKHVTSERVMSRMNVACLIWMSHDSYEWVMSHMNESWLIWMSQQVTYECGTLRISHVTYEWVMSHVNESCHVWMSHVTYEWVMSRLNEPCHIWMNLVTCEWVMVIGVLCGS